MLESDVILLARDGKFRGKKLKGSIEETHISWVILSKKFVFKIKKPIKLSFLDFSTLKSRKTNCERELILNRRFSDIYRAVVPIVANGNEYVIGETAGRIVDYAVQMKRMSVAKRMDKVLKKGGVSNQHVISIAEAIAKIHNVCMPVYMPFKLLDAKRLFNDIKETKGFVYRTLGQTYVNIISACILWSNKFLRNHIGRLQDRIDAGFKRDLHGDLHSGNIFLYRKPVIFDCIEFNDGFRQIDVLYEVAFLCMDLEAYGRRDLANKFLSVYKDCFKCFFTREDTQIFNYFKCLRANVRAKVHAMSAMQAENETELQQHLAMVKTYFQLMKSYALT